MNEECFGPIMKNAMHLESLLSQGIPELARAPTRSLFIFASLNLGIWIAGGWIVKRN